MGRTAHWPCDLRCGVFRIPAKLKRSIKVWATKQISARRWNKNEPVPVGTEGAIWMAKAIKKKSVTNPNVSGASGLGVRYFDRWTDWQPANSAGVGAAQLTVLRPNLNAKEMPPGAPLARVYPLPVRGS